MYAIRSYYVCQASYGLVNCDAGGDYIPAITGYPSGYVASVSFAAPTSTAVTLIASGSVDVDYKTYQLNRNNFV